MSSTIVLVALFSGLLVLQVVLWAVCLRFGLRWAKVADVTTRRVVLATATVIVGQVAFAIALRLATPTSGSQQLLLTGLDLAAAVLVPCLVIARVFKTSAIRSFQAWAPTLLSSVGTALILFVVLRPFVLEAFVTPTNSMAPTLLGRTWRGKCPECGRLNYCSPIDPRYAPPESNRMICGGFHVTQVADAPRQVFAPDRFLVAKFLAPRRWDVVVFQYPEKPSTSYVMRLVGLPGETIHIEDGAVWADGERLEPPSDLRDIEYLAELPDGYDVSWGTKDRPAVLGADEYFVLGDFSAQSKDSRLWERGASGHPPFAVPASHLRGVVTHVYWPPQRWRILR